MSVRVLERPEEFPALKHAWNRIAMCHSDGVSQLDVTSTYEWAAALGRIFLENKNQKVLLLKDEEEIAGLLPFYESEKTIHGIKCRRVSPITEIYSGRSGFLLDEPRVDHLEAIIEYLRKDLGDWDVFVFTLVDGSPSLVLWEELQGRRGYRCEKICSETSPYIVFEGTWPEYFASLPKKFRWTIRNGGKKLRAVGEVLYKEFESDSDVEYFAEAMLAIERASWKESAGSSVTANAYQESFYREFFPAAASSGWFCGHLLELNGEPIAYICGLRYKNIFCDLKESYKHQYTEFSPGHVLKMFAFERLYAQEVSHYDFMGACEDYKMRWTDKTYTRSSYVMYRDSLRGVAARTLGKLASSFRRGTQP